MQRTKFTITIGIPAFNEEKNIKKLLNSISKQILGPIQLDKIIVISDHSTDNTVLEIKSVKSKKILLIQNKKRIGQALCQNEMCRLAKSEALVILNADIMIKDKKFLQKLVEPIRLNKSVGLVSPQIIPLPAKTLFERVINFSVSLKYDIYTKLQKGNNIFMCHGRARAISKKIYKKIKWPRITAEDAFSYLFCLKNKYMFVYQPKTAIYYKSPINYRDHFFQSSRFMISETEFRRHFSKGFVKQQYQIPSKLIIGVMVKYFIKQPIYLIYYLLILSNIKFVSKYKTSGMWDIAASSKKLTTLFYL